MSAPVAASISSRLAAPSRARETNVAAAGSDPEAEVLRHRQVVAERELLMDDADAGGERLLRPLKSRRACRTTLDVPAVRLVDAGEDLSERALAGAVLAAERMTGPRGDREADVLEREDAGKSLGDVLEGDRWGHEQCQLPVPSYQSEISSDNWHWNWNLTASSETLHPHP